jgi:hypothetical protein
MAHLEEFCTITASATYHPTGKTPLGFRVDTAFEGTATSPHWEGARPVTGLDYAVVRADGHSNLEIRGRIGTGKETVFYTAGGVARPGEARGHMFPQEWMVFETANEELAFLNGALAVAMGELNGPDLLLTVYLVSA